MEARYHAARISMKYTILFPYVNLAFHLTPLADDYIIVYHSAHQRLRIPALVPRAQAYPSTSSRKRPLLGYSVPL